MLAGGEGCMRGQHSMLQAHQELEWLLPGGGGCVSVEGEVCCIVSPARVEVTIAGWK